MPYRVRCVVVDGVELAGRHTADWLSPASSTSPRTGTATASCPARASPRTSCSAPSATASGGLINWSQARAEAVRAIDEFSVKTPSAATPCGQLSGGNIQRVILARAFAHQPQVLLLHNPTRGLDLASTRFVYDRVRRPAAAAPPSSSSPRTSTS